MTIFIIIYLIGYVIAYYINRANIKNVYENNYGKNNDKYSWVDVIDNIIASFFSWFVVFIHLFVFVKDSYKKFLSETKPPKWL